MSGSSKKRWSDVPNVSKMLSQEKANFAGLLTCPIFYGINIILFFKCMCALLGPAKHTTGSLRWLLVAHTGVVFVFVTVFTAINLEILSTSYIDNRGFPNDSYPGPLRYQYLAFSETAGIVSTLTFLMNNWLADGLLLYRCHIIFPMRRWVMAFPCLLYLASFVTGIMLVYYQITQPSCFIWRSTTINIGVPYSLSVSLNVSLTLTIIARLVLLSRDIQKAMNAPFRLSALYKAVITVISESSAIYGVTFLLFIGTWAADDPSQYFFFPLLAQAQVIAPLLIVLQVTNRRALANDTVSGDASPIRYRSQGESTCGGWTPPSGHSATSTVTSRNNTGALAIEVVTTVDLHHDKI